MPSDRDKTNRNDPGPYWRDVQPHVKLSWLRLSKTRVFGLVVALASVAGAAVNRAFAIYLIEVYSRVTGDTSVPQGAMLFVGVCSLPFLAVLLVGFCYGLAVLLTGRMSTAFTSRESSRTQHRPSTR